MRFLISGSSGMVGTALREVLARDGHTVHRLVRPGGKAEPGSVRWDPAKGEFDHAAADGVDVVVNLAGASIAEGRWSEARKHLLRSSRVDATRVLVSGLAKLSARPNVLVSASAIGYYGNRGEEELTEGSPAGKDFLSEVGREWEAEAVRAEQAGIRTVILRFGVILSPRGGALARMLLPFKLGLGGRLGSGRQWMSWLTLPEAVGMIRYAAEQPGLRGPVNAVAPNPARNTEFTKALGRVLGRPTLFPAPAFALRLALGEVADALLLSSQRVVPNKLKALHYPFVHPDLDQGFRAVLGTGS